MIKINFNEAKQILLQKLVENGCPQQKATLVSRIITENSLDGVYSHGLNRFTGLIDAIKNGDVFVDANVQKVSGFGAIEVLDGKYGIGIYNANFAMERACALAKEHGIGCVGLKNTNHWFRAGTYGYIAANNGMIGICFTNTIPNMPAWGAEDPRLGNNPIVFAIPREKGHIVADFAMSQFAYGKLEVARLAGKQMSMDAGYDTNGNITKDPQEITKSRRLMPMGYWKGSAMSMVLDLITSSISMGKTVEQIGNAAKTDTGISQTFIAINHSAIHGKDATDKLADQTVEYVLASKAMEGQSVRYPGMNVLNIREENLKNGIPVDPRVWEKIQNV